MNGATIAPYRPNPSISPIAVDWIYTVNASVSIQPIKQFALTNLRNKFTWKNTRNSNEQGWEYFVFRNERHKIQQTYTHSQQVKSWYTKFSWNITHYIAWNIKKRILTKKRDRNWTNPRIMLLYPYPKPTCAKA